ncbi:flagellin N-terminal helical domain-containing protein [Pannonibacter sp. SL95]|uniref:flagellin N-terminal helical domain-containing protein n=2 Tax=unclassified Pannonibacter TaxID=2627228 RepID=UPI0022746DC8|nr:flagellin [Pannonibacter sp. SL95]MCY1705712.1 flagellin [Pannonibacter sp. SL95]
MAGITISSSVRSNLNALQSTSEMMSRVQEKLSTGKKVNSALDNPNSFFTAKGLENRSSDLGTLLDDMGQTVQTLKAADKGITSISGLVDAAKAKANQAAQTSSQTQRAQFAKEFNELMTQIESVAKDSGYKGKNLLGGTGNDLKVTFNENGSSKLDISAVNFTDTTSTTGLNLSDLATGTSGTTTITLTNGTATTALTGGSLLTSDSEFAAGDVISLTDTNGAEIGKMEVKATTTVGDLEKFLDDTDGVTASLATNTMTVTSEFKLTMKSSSSAVGSFADRTTNNSAESGFAKDSDIDAALKKLKGAQDTLRAQASTFGTNLSIVQNRQDFTKAMINTLEEGAGKLTLADTNQEGANLLALQTQQSLASTALSLASQADQNVLRLF